MSRNRPAMSKTQSSLERSSGLPARPSIELTMTAPAAIDFVHVYAETFQFHGAA